MRIIKHASPPALLEARDPDEWLARFGELAPKYGRTLRFNDDTVHIVFLHGAEAEWEWHTVTPEDAAKQSAFLAPTMLVSNMRDNVAFWLSHGVLRRWHPIFGGIEPDSPTLEHELRGRTWIVRASRMCAVRLMPKQPYQDWWVADLPTWASALKPEKDGAQ